MQNKLLLALSALAAIVALQAHARPARACLNSVEEERRYMEQYEPPALVAKADRALSHGRLSAAAAQVLEVYPAIRGAEAKSAPPIMRRALRVLALALVRLDGKLGVDGWARAGNLEWAETTLAELVEVRGGDPAARADHAEALAALPRDHARALAVLEDLDRRDLLGSHRAYLALASLRLELGDEGGALAAVRRCHAMSTARHNCAMPTTPKRG